MPVITPLGSYLPGFLSLTPLGGAALGALAFLFCRRFTRCGREVGGGRLLLLALLFLWAGVVFSLTIPIAFPSQWHPGANVRYVLASIQYRPLESSLLIYKNCASIQNYWPFLRLVVGNFFLLAPFGVLLPALWPRRWKLGRVALLAGGISLGIEGSQLLINLLCGSLVRTVEIDDLILNLSGCVACYLLFALCRALWRRCRKKAAR
ncbi:VanZ family protein [Acetanaerobacterium sp. MSJ-12]|uniref:VanZ family protein n=1 Tax=Acetanaerobacterium sp. MSJ-12 TaxID=2841535 RepID=UPI001C0EEB0D|nr:VanZ family protein [Acetanaerobacterium sp. MSJ-12]MBU5420264.1 VanZ family protein [Acetanaerobacterium sp. MSJ-12]